MPRLLRLYRNSVLTGFLLALCFTNLLLFLDVAGLWHLVTHVRGGVVAVVMLVVFHTILFSGVQFAYVVMRLSAKGPGRPGGRRVRTGMTAVSPALGHVPAARGKTRH